MIEIPCVAAPGPSAHPGAAWRSGILKGSVSPIAEDRIPHGVSLIQRAGFWRRIALKNLLCGNALAGRGPHVSDVEVFEAIVVIIEPANAHACADIFHSRLRRDVGKCPIAVIAVEVLASEVVHHVQVGPSVAVVVAPTATKAIARVVLIEAR